MKKNQNFGLKFCIVFYCNNSAFAIATHDIITAIGDVTAAADDVIHIICISQH